MITRFSWFDSIISFIHLFIHWFIHSFIHNEMLIFITFFILILNFHSLAHCSLISGWIKEGRHVSCPEKVLHGPQKPGHCYPRNMWSPQNRWVIVIPTRLTQHVTYEALSKQYHCWKYIRYLSLNVKSIFEAILLTLILFAPFLKISICLLQRSSWNISQISLLR